MGWSSLLATTDKAARQHLGGPVTYTPGVGSAVQVTGIFDAIHQHVDVGQPGVTASGPAVFLALSDLPSDPETDTAARVTIAGVVYAITTPEKDGQGGVLLRLNEVT
jgi:hypothetical protein